jgi:hypothetical protein
MINNYLRGSAYIESVMGSLISGGVLVLSFSCSFRGFPAFSCLLLVFAVFYRTFLSFSLTFGLLATLNGVLDLNFNFVPFIVNGLIKEEIEKPSDQLLSLIVLSH